MLGGAGCEIAQRLSGLDNKEKGLAFLFNVRIEKGNLRR
jgi:hypothetical protein